jgi:hypothetical protein
MKISISYKKKNYRFLVKVNNKVFLIFLIKKLNSVILLKNISLIIYNYILLIKILRIYGLSKPLINKKDY